MSMKVAEVIETSIELLVMGFGLSVGEVCAFVASKLSSGKGFQIIRNLESYS